MANAFQIVLQKNCRRIVWKIVVEMNAAGQILNRKSVVRRRVMHLYELSAWSSRVLLLRGLAKR